MSRSSPPLGWSANWREGLGLEAGDDIDSSSQPVVVIDAMAAKGLEFDTAVVVAPSEIPRRLLYVQRLTSTHPSAGSGRAVADSGRVTP